MLVEGPQLDTPIADPWSIGSHTIHIPHRYRSFKKVLAVRNPIERAISSWLFETKWRLFRQEAGSAPATWLDYLSRIADGDAPTGTFHTWTLLDYCKFEGGVDDVIRLEHWVEDIPRIFGELAAEWGVDRWEPENSVLSSDRPPAEHFLRSKDSIEIALEIWGDDLRTWYPEELEKWKARLED